MDMYNVQQQEDFDYEMNARYDYIREAYGHQLDGENEYQSDKDLEEIAERAAFIGPRPMPSGWDMEFMWPL